MRTLTVPLACVALVCSAPTFAVAQDVSIVEVWRSSGEPVSSLAGAHTDGRTIWLLDGLSQEVHAFVNGTEEVDRLVLLYRQPTRCLPSISRPEQWIR